MTFEQLEELFFSHKINASPSGFHGFLCGRLSCGAVDLKQLVDASTSWLALSQEQAEAAEGSFETFYQNSLNDLKILAFFFSPYCPMMNYL